ncbi:MAG: pyridoxamine 5'-phosphate oxidase family protein [Ruminiclostridium sp.]|nr:pyridoxamine 5'-phosphate oxidase family protein [Ruminiclostridium sp.]
MESFSSNAREIMEERFGHDTLIALATIDGNKPSVRTVNGYYEDGSFYVITHAKSDKMKQIERNPVVAVSGDWFSAHGVGENLGWFRKSSNLALAGKLKKVFETWIDNGHNDFNDENTCILRIRLTDGVLLSHGSRIEIRFSEE